MSRPKAFLQPSKAQKKRRDLPPETVDEYQAAAIEHEEAGEKWRAGDATKSMRFFQRAISVYEEGLQRYPHSLDLAYNKARVQFEMATHPVLVKQIQEPLVSLLETTLASHRYALSIDSENADTLFNTAQVLTSLAEEVAKARDLPDNQGLPLLEEALELQNRCLSIQEYEFTASQEQQAAAIANAAESELEGQNPATAEEEGGFLQHEAPDAEEERWASIVEPVTQDTLIDTIEAQLATLTTLCGILSTVQESKPTVNLAWVEEYSTELLNVKLPAYLRNTPSRIQDMALTKANFMSSLLEAGFRLENLDAQTYKRERDATFTAPEIGMSTSAAALIANAVSLIAFNTAVAETVLVDVAPLSSMRWNALSAAVSDLREAAKMPNIAPEDLPRTQALRGDASLLQYQLSQPALAFSSAVANAVSVLKNAEVFYRNASKLSRNQDEKDEATLKEVAAVYLQDVAAGKAKMQALLDRQSQTWILGQLEDLAEEGLIDQEAAALMVT